MTFMRAVGERIAVSEDVTQGEQCEACGKNRSFRSHRRWWERVRTLVSGMVPYRCLECGYRQYIWIDPRDLKRVTMSTRHSNET
jgi:hypothetical protein